MSKEEYLRLEKLHEWAGSDPLWNKNKKQKKKRNNLSAVHMYTVYIQAAINELHLYFSVYIYIY